MAQAVSNIHAYPRQGDHDMKDAILEYLLLIALITVVCFGAVTFIQSTPH